MKFAAPLRPRSTAAAALAVATALLAVAGAEWASVTQDFPFGVFEVRTQPFGIAVVARESGVAVRVQPCHETAAREASPHETIPVCAPGTWPGRAEPGAWTEAWAAFDAVLGRPRVSWVAARDRPISIVVRPDAIALRFEKRVAGLGPGIAHYAHAFALEDAHVVHDERGVAYTRLDDAALLARLGLEADTDPDPWRGLPEDAGYLALLDTRSGAALYLLGQPGSRLRVDRRRNIVLRQERLSTAQGSPLEVAVRLHAALPAGLAR